MKLRQLEALRLVLARGTTKHAAESLGLTQGNNYSFDLFFAERHTTQANFMMQTSIVLDNNIIPLPSAAGREQYLQDTTRQ